MFEDLLPHLARSRIVQLTRDAHNRRLLRHMTTRRLGLRARVAGAVRSFGLPALSLGDALATDLSDFFTPQPTDAPYVRADAPSPGS